MQQQQEYLFLMPTISKKHPQRLQGNQAMLNRKQRRAIQFATQEQKQEQANIAHEWDDDACCIICGFDEAEWWHWKHNTYEGRASIIKQPPCKKGGY